MLWFFNFIIDDAMQVQMNKESQGNLKIAMEVIGTWLFVLSLLSLLIGLYEYDTARSDHDHAWATKQIYIFVPATLCIAALRWIILPKLPWKKPASDKQDSNKN